MQFRKILQPPVDMGALTRHVIAFTGTVNEKPWRSAKAEYWRCLEIRYTCREDGSVEVLHRFEEAKPHGNRLPDLMEYPIYQSRDFSAHDFGKPFSPLVAAGVPIYEG